MKEAILKIVHRYRPLGINKGGEFLLPPDKAISLVKDLSQVGILILGCDLWRFLDPEKDPRRIVSLLGAGFAPSAPIPPESESPERNARLITEFLQTRLPEDAELVSLIVDDAEIDILLTSNNI